MRTTTLLRKFDIRRVSCPTCQAVKVERVAWAETCSWFTVPFEDHVAYLAQRCDQTTVSASMRIAWQTVGAIVQRVVARRRQGDPLDGLVTIGVDELSSRRHHQYVTVVVDHATQLGELLLGEPDRSVLQADLDPLARPQSGRGGIRRLSAHDHLRPLPSLFVISLDAREGHP